MLRTPDTRPPPSRPATLRGDPDQPRLLTRCRIVLLAELADLGIPASRPNWSATCRDRGRSWTRSKEGAPAAIARRAAAEQAYLAINGRTRLSPGPGEPGLHVGDEAIEVVQPIEAGVDPAEVHGGILVDQDVAEAGEPFQSCHGGV